MNETSLTLEVLVTLVAVIAGILYLLTSSIRSEKLFLAALAILLLAGLSQLLR
jgi:hypothetical protein